MKRPLLVLAALLVPPAGAVIFLRASGGFSAREEPTALERVLARTARRLAAPCGARDLVNPVPAGSDVLAEARAHFADHCAVCHANDGSGDTPIGRSLYPKAPDMRLEPTQSLSDGELFYIISNGIRLSGMPAWGSGDPKKDGQSWMLVHFIRHLPYLSEEEIAEMRRLNPRSPHEREEEESIRRFLLGRDPEETGPGTH